MTPDELRAAVSDDSIDAVIAAFADHYGRLLGKRFDASFFCESMTEGTHACDYLFTEDMEMEPVPGYQFASWEQGYGDVHLVPDLATLRTAAWTDGATIVLCDVAKTGHELIDIAPRSILRRQLERLADHGFTAMAGSELEFFIFDESYREAHDRRYADLHPAGWYIEDYHLLQASRVEPYVRAGRRALASSGIPVETSKGEGPSLPIECRLPGADCNPYLAYAATIASGLAGIEQELTPPDEFRGDVYQAHELRRVPHSLHDAIPTFASSETAQRALGDAVVDHYAHALEVEAASSESAVTDWDRSRYFDRI